MNVSAVHIRVSKDQDREKIFAVHRSAFGDNEGPVIASLVGSPVDRMRMRLRARYDIQDVHDNHRLPHTLWLHTEINLTLRARDSRSSAELASASTTSISPRRHDGA